MAAKITRKDVSQYKALAKKEGRDISHLSDDQIIAQIRIQRGGMATPTPSDLSDILARAKVTEKLFQQCREDVLSDLKKALGDLQALGPAGARKAKGGPAAPLPKLAERVVALRRTLLSYPPSMLPPEFQRTLALVDSWARHGEKLLAEKDPGAALLLRGVPGELAKAIDGLTGASGARG